MEQDEGRGTAEILDICTVERSDEYEIWNGSCFKKRKLIPLLFQTY